MTTLNDFYTRIKEYAEDCADSYTSSTELRFDTRGNMVYKTRESDYTLSMGGVPNDHAYSQLIGRLQAPPAGWLLDDKKCFPELRAKIMNNLAVARAKDGLFIRHKGDTIRGVMSDEYTKFDNVKFIELVQEAVTSNGLQVDVLRPVVGDHLSAYVMIPSITFDHDPRHNTNGNGGLHPCVYITNNEVGAGAARVTGALYRAYCGNGSISGYKAEETLAVRHRFISQGAMLSLVASGIASGLRMSEQAAKDYVAAQDVHIEPVNLKSIVDKWAARYGLTVSAKDNWLAAVVNESVEMSRKEDPRAIDIFNGATFSAKTISNVQERELVERMAGDYLTEQAASHRSAMRYASTLRR